MVQEYREISGKLPPEYTVGGRLVNIFVEDLAREGMLPPKKPASPLECSFNEFFNELFLLSRHLAEGYTTGMYVSTEDAQRARAEYRRQIIRFGELIIPLITEPDMANLLLRYPHNGESREKQTLGYWSYYKSRPNGEKSGRDANNCSTAVELVRRDEGFSLDLVITERYRIEYQGKKYADLEQTYREFQEVISGQYPPIHTGNNLAFALKKPFETREEYNMSARRALESTDLPLVCNLLIYELPQVFRDARSFLERRKSGIPLYTPKDVERLLFSAKACEVGLSLVETMLRERK